MLLQIRVLLSNTQVVLGVISYSTLGFPNPTFEEYTRSKWL